MALVVDPEVNPQPEVSPLIEPSVPIVKLPLELIEKVFILFIENKCPLLFSLFKTGCLPVNSEKDGSHVNSDFIQKKLKKEHASLLPLLRLSAYFYGIVSRLLISHNAYVGGVRSFECLDLFAKRQASEYFVIPELPPIHDTFRKEGDPYDPYDPAWDDQPELYGSPSGVRPYRRFHPMRFYSFDRSGEGTEWRPREPGETSWKPKGWEMYPYWLTGGSRPSGIYLFSDDDAEVKKIDECESFVTQLKSLIITPDLETWMMDQPHIYGGTDDTKFPDMNFTAPSRHLMYKVFDSLGKTSKLEKLVISGNVLRNACWLAPKTVGEFHPLAHLTHLTLSLSESPSQQDSPLIRLQKYIETPNDCHLCNLLTGRNGYNGTTVPVPFLKTLKHLHLRGPGAHACSNLFNADWKSLEKVVVEMGTHRGICDGEILGLFYSLDNIAQRRPKMEIEITVRVCEPEYEKAFFSHHWWRVYPAPIPTVETINQASGTGEILLLAKKVSGPTPPVYPAPEKLLELDHFIRRELDQATAAVQQIWATEGVDPLTMTYIEDEIWETAEQEELLKPVEDSDDPVFLDSDTIAQLRARADGDWVGGFALGFRGYWVDE